MCEEDELAPPEVVDAVLRDLRLDFRLIVVQGPTISSLGNRKRWRLPWRPSWRARSGREERFRLRLGSGRTGY